MSGNESAGPDSAPAGRLSRENRTALTIGVTIVATLAVVFVAALIFFNVIGGSNNAQRNADGAYVGVVSSVSRDRLTLDVDGGGSVRFDTWSVCGDNTSRFISTGDRLVVHGTRDLFDYEAWRILDENGNPACE